ncbi:terpene synthase 10-like isoform X1 [Vicia villosa]|uniref:terpene synthase 10-like isoform X1 n=1 Tax=Vicia villosa TaxID=3911 RepID=UPI00273C3AC6|nr:terpene synthase 10-like isoform X1 [Vicia villosa]
MALPTQLSFNKMFLHENRSRSLALVSWNSNISCPTKCSATNEVSNNHNQNIPRPSSMFQFQPSIWTDDYIQSLNSEYKGEIYAKKFRVLREKVKMMFNKMESEVYQLEFIDVLQRLGVDYHFNYEIRNMLDNIYNTQTSNLKNNLYATALKFRLLRQHGYDISTDVFVCFQDEIYNLKKDEAIVVEGMLSMYEASFHSFEDETILDEARDFTTKFLKEDLNKHGDDDVMSIQISHALEFPLHWRISRSEARWFINIYERQHNKSCVLLHFAKLDFNIVQSIYQEELKYSSRWWEKIEFGEKLSFARNRLVENYVWTVGTNSKPDFEYYRKEITKVGCFITTIDDIYEMGGTLEELELFTKAIDRWDLNAMEPLPHHMKICFHALYNFVNEISFETLKRSGNNITSYLKKGWTDLCKSFLIEAKWYHNGYTPSFEEYLENAMINIGVPNVLIHTYFFISNTLKMEDLASLEENSNLIRYPAILLRLANDLGTNKREKEMGDYPKSIQCYMKETGSSEEEAFEYVKSTMYSTWRKLNKESHISSFSTSFIEIAMNIGRMALFMYQHGDGHSIQDSKIQNGIMSLIFQAIPIIYTTHHK